jgi:hypothetical protein
MSDASPRVKEVGAFIIGNIDEDGYLRANNDEILAAGPFTQEEVDASQPAAFERLEGRDRKSLRLTNLFRAERRRNFQARAVIDVLGVVGIKAVRMIHDNLARDGRDRLVVAEHGAFDLAAVDALLYHHLGVERERCIERTGKLGARMDFRDTDG